MARSHQASEASRPVRPRSTPSQTDDEKYRPNRLPVYYWEPSRDTVAGTPWSCLTRPQLSDLLVFSCRPVVLACSRSPIEIRVTDHHGPVTESIFNTHHQRSNAGAAAANAYGSHHGCFLFWQKYQPVHCHRRGAPCRRWRCMAGMHVKRLSGVDCIDTRDGHDAGVTNLVGFRFHCEM